MRALMLVSGSLGDMYPFLAIGQALSRRGHAVAIGANEIYADLVARHGFEFVQTGSRTEFETILRSPDLWSAERAFHAIWGMALAKTRPLLSLIESQIDRDTVLVSAPMTALAARLAHEVLGLPLVTIALAPALLSTLPTVHHPLQAFDSAAMDRTAGAQFNRLRAELGLAPVERIFDRWAYSPQRVIGMFPEWFASPWPDWPENLTLAGFPFYDDAQAWSPDPALEEFLSSGPAPVIFTPGTAMHQGEAFFSRALAALERTGTRGIFLSRSMRHLPPLPDSVRHLAYAPLAALLPRAAAIVHHGGIGTAAQAIRAGIAQMVVPFAHDQLDNALRIERLECGLRCPPDADIDDFVAGLRRLLDGQGLGPSHRLYQARIVSEARDACATSALAIESAFTQGASIH